MLASNRSAGVAPEANLREHVTCIPLSSMNKAAHSGFELRNPEEMSPHEDIFFDDMFTLHAYAIEDGFYSD